MNQVLSPILFVAAIFIASLQLPVFYKANTDYVKSVATVAALQ